MDVNRIQNNIDAIPSAVLIADAKLNIIAKNSFARQSTVKTRLGASLGHYISYPDIGKLGALANGDAVVVDFVKNTITSFVAVRYDTEIINFLLFEAHLHCFIEKRIKIAGFVPEPDVFGHFRRITKEVFTTEREGISAATERFISKRQKVNNYLWHLISLTNTQDSGPVKQPNNIIFELNALAQMFGVLAKSVGVVIRWDMGRADEIFSNFNRGDIFLSFLILLHFAMVTAGDKSINFKVLNFDTLHYITIEYATSLPEELVYRLITEPEPLEEISDSTEYECFFLLRQIKSLLRQYAAELTFSLPGSSLSNLRIAVKITSNDSFTELFHEPDWIEEQLYGNDPSRGLWKGITPELSNDKAEKDNTFTKIYNVVKLIPKGKVANYGTVATIAGNRAWARVVGYALHKNPNPEEIPCHRVVKRNGGLAEAFVFGGINKQRELLEAEGVTFNEDGEVLMEKHFWGGF